MVEYVNLEEEEKNIKKNFKKNTYISVVLPLIAVNVIMFIIQMNFGNNLFYEYLLLESEFLLDKPWSLITAMFLHGSFFHLLFNMYALFIFGFLLESRIGWKKFLGLYFISGALVSFAATFLYPSALGASGAIMAVVGTTIFLFPKLKILFFFVIPMNLWVLGVIIFSIDFFGIISNSGSNIAHGAHLVGFLIGLAYGFYIVENKKKILKKFKVREFK